MRAPRGTPVCTLPATREAAVTVPVPPGARPRPAPRCRALPGPQHAAPQPLPHALHAGLSVVQQRWRYCAGSLPASMADGAIPFRVPRGGACPPTPPAVLAGRAGAAAVKPCTAAAAATPELAARRHGHRTGSLLGVHIHRSMEPHCCRPAGLLPFSSRVSFWHPAAAHATDAPRDSRARAHARWYRAWMDMRRMSET